MMARLGGEYNNETIDKNMHQIDTVYKKSSPAGIFSSNSSLELKRQKQLFNSSLQSLDEAGSLVTTKKAFDDETTPAVINGEENSTAANAEKMISEWVKAYRSSPEDTTERNYLIRKGISFYKNHPAEFFEECIFDIINTFKSNTTDQSLQWDGLKFIYSSLPKQSIDKLSSASSVSMRSVGSTFSSSLLPQDEKFVRWARQISLLVARDDEFMAKVFRFFCEHRHQQDQQTNHNTNVAQQVLRVLCYYQPLVVCSFLTRNGALLKQTFNEMSGGGGGSNADDTTSPRLRASFYSYIVYIIDKNPPSKSNAVCRELFYSQAFVAVVRFLKTFTPVEKKPHRSVTEATKLLARIFAAADERIAEKFFSAPKFIEALLLTCRRWCAVCETLRIHFIMILRALCVHQRVLSRAVIYYKSSISAGGAGTGDGDVAQAASTTTIAAAAPAPKVCLLPLLMQMSLSGDVEFFTQLIECIRLAIGYDATNNNNNSGGVGDDDDSSSRNNYVFFDPIDPTASNVTMVNQLPRLILSRQTKPNVRLAAARLFCDIIVPELQRVEDICSSMINSQEPLQGFLKRAIDHSDPVGVYAVCFALTRLVAVAHGAASASTAGSILRSATATSDSSKSASAATATSPQQQRPHSVECDFKQLYMPSAAAAADQTVGGSSVPSSSSCLLLRMLELLDKAANPIALFGTLQFFVVFERHYSVEFMQLVTLRRNSNNNSNKRVLLALGNVVTLCGETPCAATAATIAARRVNDVVVVDSSLAAHQTLLTSLNYLFALYLLKRIYEQQQQQQVLSSSKNSSSSSSTTAMSGHAAYCARVLFSENAELFVKKLSAQAKIVFSSNTDADKPNNNVNNMLVQDIFAAAESYLFMPPSSMYYVPLLTSLEEFYQLHHESSQNRKSIKNVVAAIAKSVPPALPTTNNRQSKQQQQRESSKTALDADMKKQRARAEQKEKRIGEAENKLAETIALFNAERKREHELDQEFESVKQLHLEDLRQKQQLNVAEPAAATDKVADVAVNLLNYQIASLQKNIEQIQLHWMPSVATNTQQVRAELAASINNHYADDESSASCNSALETHIQLSAAYNDTFQRCSTARQKAVDEQAKAEAVEKMLQLLRAMNDGNAHAKLSTVSSRLHTREGERNATRKIALRKRSAFDADLVTLARKNELAKQLQAVMEQNDIAPPDVTTSFSTTFADSSFFVVTNMMSQAAASAE